MNIKKHIPNLFTLGNLISGCIALLYVFSGNYEATAFFVLLGIVFDFFDGFLARILKVQGELGKQLDSLADMVTSGVVPGFVMFSMMNEGVITGISNSVKDKELLDLISIDTGYLPFFGFLLIAAACYRLGKFNIDTRQSDSFIGVPTPAMTLFVVSLPLINSYTEVEVVRALLENTYFLMGITLLLSYLMNANLPLLALKFKNFKWKGNEFRFVLIAISLIILVTLQYLAIPLIIIAYILLSIIQNVTVNKS